jgi:hypothetical protein
MTEQHLNPMNSTLNHPLSRSSTALVVILLIVVASVSCATHDSINNANFSCQKTENGLSISHAGQPLMDFVFKDTNIFRPYFAHVQTLDGIQVTRTHPPVAGVDPVDHATMHPGIWMAFGDISGQDFWRNKAVIRQDGFLATPDVRKGKLAFATESTLFSTNHEAIANLVSSFTIEPVADGYLVIWNAAFTPMIDGFTFGDQEEMGFGVRVATPISEKNGGTVRNSEGITGAKAAWGKTAEWCDYSGVISNRLVGMTVMADPTNFRPSWMHSRDYGLVVANPFGQRAFTKGEPSSVPVEKGSTFKLRFAAFIHSTPTNQPPDIAAAYKSFVSGK